MAQSNLQSVDCRGFDLFQAVNVLLADVFLQDQFEARVLQQILVVPYEKVQFEMVEMGNSHQSLFAKTIQGYPRSPD